MVPQLQVCSTKIGSGRTKLGCSPAQEIVISVRLQLLPSKGHQILLVHEVFGRLLNLSPLAAGGFEL